MVLDYASCKLVWWCLMGLLSLAFLLTDGRHLGAEMALPWLGRTDAERRLILNAIGPTHSGGMTWFVAVGGSLFAVWPTVYAVALSGFYLAVMLCLFAMLLRPAALHYRSKRAGPRWRRNWDWCVCAGGALPALILGVLAGNLPRGLPFRFDDAMRLDYQGGVAGLFHPFALLAGALGIALLLTLGAASLQYKTGGAVAGRARRACMAGAALTIVLFAGAGACLAAGIDGYRVTAMPDAGGAFLPMAKTVVRAPGAWLDNYRRWPLAWTFPAMAVGGAALAMLSSARRLALPAVLCSGLAGAGIVLSAGAAMFPFILPSSLSPDSSLTAWDAAASHGSLMLMFWVAVILLPIVFAYTAWVHRILRGKVTPARANDHDAY